jgi:polar amino acid transport system substrate-binding protein
MCSWLSSRIFRKMARGAVLIVAGGTVSVSAALVTVRPVQALTSQLLSQSTQDSLSSPQLDDEEATLRVGVAGSPPFVINDNGNFQGISIDIWKVIALKGRFEYEFIPQETVSAGLNAVAEEKVDILIGPISITPERLARENIEFTQPYFIGQFGLLLPALKPSVWNRVAPLFGIAALSSITLLIILLFIVGNLIWLAERRKNPEQFPPDYSSGVRNGVWFALVTLTTVGYGDRTPVTKTGQLIAGIWMIITLVTVSSLTAGLASALTAAISGEKAREQFNNLEDLAGASIGVVAETSGAQLAQEYQARLTKSETLEGAINLLLQGKTAGVIFDHPALRYYLSQHPELKVRLSNLVLGYDTYGFAIPFNNKTLEKELNVLLLELRADRLDQQIADHWLNQSDF